MYCSQKSDKSYNYQKLLLDWLRFHNICCNVIPITNPLLIPSAFPPYHFSGLCPVVTILPSSEDLCNLRQIGCYGFVLLKTPQQPDGQIDFSWWWISTTLTAQKEMKLDIIQAMAFSRSNCTINQIQLQIKLDG